MPQVQVPCVSSRARFRVLLRQPHAARACDLLQAHAARAGALQVKGSRVRVSLGLGLATQHRCKRSSMSLPMHQGAGAQAAPPQAAQLGLGMQHRPAPRACSQGRRASCQSWNSRAAL